MYTVVGMSFRKPEEREKFSKLPIGTVTLKLEREPSNPYDPNAVKVLDLHDGDHYGYISRTEAFDLSREMDEDEEREWHCKIVDRQARFVFIEVE